MLRPTALYWYIVALGLAPFYLYNRLNLAQTFVSRTPRLKMIRVAETAAVFLYLAVEFLWKCDFAVASSPAALAWAGVVMAVAGALLASWAKFSLRRYFSVILGVQKGHELITTGPYALARHPMYTGLLLVMIGGAMVYNSGVTLLLLVAPFCAFFYWQSAEEERLFVEHFGDAYRRYQAQTGRFLPRLPTS